MKQSNTMVVLDVLFILFIPKSVLITLFHICYFLTTSQ